MRAIVTSAVATTAIILGEEHEEGIDRSEIGAFIRLPGTALSPPIPPENLAFTAIPHFFYPVYMPDHTFMVKMIELFFF